MFGWKKYFYNKSIKEQKTKAVKHEAYSTSVLLLLLVKRIKIYTKDLLQALL